MAQIIRYLSHPQVVVDPSKDVPNWSLSEIGKARVTALAASGALAGTARIVSSGETKALETARPLARALGCPLDLREKMHENDRSATGYLPGDVFEAAADQFFAQPDTSYRGWETARAAQNRTVAEVQTVLAQHKGANILFVGHGAVGTLLYCHLAQKPISRAFDQGTGGGGCYLEYDPAQPQNIAHWRPLENLIPAASD
ncbi:MAG: histidine phosphatase family protein [Marinosulfonomonas sp.]